MSKIEELIPEDNQEDKYGFLDVDIDKMLNQYSIDDFSLTQLCIEEGRLQIVDVY